MVKIFTSFLFLPSLALAANMTNQIEGVGPQGKIRPWICIQNKLGNLTLSLAPGQSGDANKASGNLSYAGATLRFDGCGNNNTYLGYVGINISSNGNNSITKYTPPDGIHISYANPNINAQGQVGGRIVYTPIKINKELRSAKAANYWELAGINLSGLEFGKVIDPTVIPNLSQEDTDSQYSDLKETEAFIQAGMNTVRVPLSWGYLQLDGPGKGSSNLDYYNNYIKPLLQTLTKAKVHTIVDLHAYMRYSKFGEQYSGCGPSGNCPDGTLIDNEEAYKSVWSQLIKLIQNDSEINKDYILLDLMNEPVKVPNDKVFTIQASLIKMLRNNQYTGYILIEGNNWSGLHSWSDEWVGDNNQVYANATLFTRENFIKSGITDLSKILINVHQYFDADYSGTHDQCLTDLTSQGPQGFNLNPFIEFLKNNQLKAIVTEFGVGKDSASCSVALNQFMQYLQQNASKGKSYGFAGWTIWSSGHGWGDYNLRVKSDSYAMQVLSDYL
ncbi:Endoglucanase precursor [Legionella beliardensis]|uniref:Endoglucanase n=1 Tax=Legionella beliardensis TaxID=91822 RepID=A0A378I2J5_9GAMM|nr:cellulase family glycosylhydrolase [Legionella beliardensis]STX29213.1 Endoglucanase precursor [Legionella beliardensis]